MKTLALRPADESSRKKHSSQPDQTLVVVREKLSALTHRIQLIIRSKPKEMLSLLEFYHYFLAVKEELEHFFTREQTLLKSLDQAGRRPGAGDTTGLTPEELEKTLARLKEELSGFVVLLSNLQINHKNLKAYSLTLTLFFKELESFVRLLDTHNDQLSYAFLLVPPADNFTQQRPFPIGA